MSSPSLQKAVFRLLPRFIQREVARSRPWGVGQYAVQLFGGESLLLDRIEKSRMLRKLFWLGTDGHEPYSLRTFYHLARHGRSILDIGACFGLYGLIAGRANSQATVHCFEPFPANVELARYLIELNQLANVSVHRMAMSNAVGRASFHVPIISSGKLPDIGSLTNRFADGRFADRPFESIDVDCTTIDRFCAISGIDQVDLIKLDVEEAELQVLEGGVQTIARAQPDIICEIIFDNPDLVGMEKLLRSFGYRFLGMTSGGLIENSTLTRPLTDDTDDRLKKKRGPYTDMLLTTKTDAQIAALLRDAGREFSAA